MIILNILYNKIRNKNKSMWVGQIIFKLYYSFFATVMEHKLFKTLLEVGNSVALFYFIYCF